VVVEFVLAKSSRRRDDDLEVAAAAAADIMVMVGILVDVDDDDDTFLPNLKSLHLFAFCHLQFSYLGDLWFGEGKSG